MTHQNATVFFSVLPSSSSFVNEQFVRRHYLTSEDAGNVLNHINHNTKILPSSCNDFVNSFNNKLQTDIDAIAPVKLSKITSKQNHHRKLEILT